MSVTLQTTKEPLGMSIGISPEAPPVERPGSQDVAGRAEAVVAEAEALIEAARMMLAAQARAEVEELRAEVGEARGMIAELERMLGETPSPTLPLEGEGRTPLRPRKQTRDRLPPGGGRERRRARPYSQRARDVLEREPLFIDYETTGLSKTDRVVEVCVMDGQGRVLLSTLVDPERHIPAGATAMNGISDGDVVDAPTWAEIAPELERLIGGRTVVAHNAAFEAKYTPEEWGVKWVCSKKLADQVLGKAAYVEIAHNKLLGGSLEARLWQCGLRPGPEHTAAGDCISTLRLVSYLAGDGTPVELVY